jgi:hypothetical protein
VEETFPTEVRATGFATASFIAGVAQAFYSLIPGIMPSVAASFPIFAAGYALLAVGFFVMKETINKPLIETVGEHAGDGPQLVEA